MIFILCFDGFFVKAEAGESPGLIESLERLLDVHHKQYEEIKIPIQSDLKILSEVSDLKDLKINSQFMRSIIFHSNDKFLRLAQKDECRFYSVLENDLLKTADGDIANIFISFKDKEDIIKNASLPKNDFFDFLYRKRCLNNKEFSTLFNEANLAKTIAGTKFNVPKNTNECEAIHKEWLDNSFTPYLCRIQQILKKSKNQKEIDFYKEKIPVFQRTYIENLCENISSPQRFCESYLKNDVWSKIINGEAPSYKLSYKCQNLIGKSENVSVDDLKACAAKLITSPNICETKGSKNFSSFFPLQNCNNISDALNKSKLITNYHDCPGNVDNEAITNVHRLINHFSPRPITANKETCSSEANYTFAKLNFDYKHREGWPLKICYINHVRGKEECTPYIPGSRDNEPLSEDKVIAQIIYKQKGAPAKTKCRIVDSKTYNPLRSEFKFGCFIIYNYESCTTMSCEKKVIWEEKQVDDIKFIGKPIFDYFPTSYANEQYSFSHMINELKGTQDHAIKNLTDLKFHLDNNKNTILHGVGCIEDLTPDEFQRVSINQCHPMPFIVDGYLVKHDETWIVFRSAIDDIHTPRLVLWMNIFNSVSAYSELHPLNTWTLYGIKK